MYLVASGELYTILITWNIIYMLMIAMISDMPFSCMVCGCLEKGKQITDMIIVALSYGR